MSEKRLTALDIYALSADNYDQLFLSCIQITLLKSHAVHWFFNQLKRLSVIFLMHFGDFRFS